MDSSASHNPAPTGPSAADGPQPGPRRRKRRRGSRGRGRRRRNQPSEPASPPPTAQVQAPETAEAHAPETVPPAEAAPAPPIEQLASSDVGSTSPAAPDELAPDDAAEVAREARNIVNDAAVDERPELYAHRLPAFGAEIVHWRPRGEREFRYLLRESFD